MSSCFDCGSPVAPEDRFCGNCGIALQTPTPRPGAEGAAASSNELLSAEPQNSPAQGATTGPTDNTTGPTDGSASQERRPPDYGDALQATIIESSHAAAAAPAREEAPAPSHDSAQLSAPEESARLSAPEEEDTETTADGGEPAGETSQDAGESSRDDAAVSGTFAGGTSSQDVGGAPQGAAAGEPSPDSAAGEPSAATGEPSLNLNAGEPTSAVSSDTGSQPPQAATGGGVDDRRRTGDLPSRPMAFTGRTGGPSSGRRSSSQLEPGTVLYGRYEIVKRIGGGG
ncbi:MAG TPA: hypothetical protein VNZ44_08750, partial [Pyrinomonadaceae bacterium]|nr:hypothetical protein [Pyrinomonadaceae bacterium]